MTKCYFSRLEPFYLLRNVGDSEGFDAYPVEVPERTLRAAERLRAIQRNMKQLFDNMPAPEEVAQQEAEEYSDMLDALVEYYDE